MARLRLPKNAESAEDAEGRHAQPVSRKERRRLWAASSTSQAGLFGGLHAWHCVALVAKFRNGAIGHLAGAIDAAQRSVFRQAVPWRERKVLAKCHLLG